jgi:nucleotide-binding universal stress UspA family protein
MKKFIAAFDGLNFSESAMEYAIELAKSAKAHLVGVFLDDFIRRSYGVTEIVSYEGSDLDKHLHELNDQDKETRDESVEVFEKACQGAGLNYSVHRDKNVALQELLHESIYADLLIIDSSETLSRMTEEPPTRFIRELLNDVQCPVLIVPKNYKGIDKLILLYDGEPSSVFAVKMFSYLLQPVKGLSTEVITVKAVEESAHVPDNRLIKEFIKRHYPKAEYIVLKGIAEEEISRYLHRSKEGAMVVLGAYRRGKLSRLFKPSMADYLLQHLKMPLFIAHNKS